MSAQTDLMFTTGAGSADMVEALTTLKGITSFWTSKGEGDAGQGQQFTLSFPGQDGPVRYELRTERAGEDSVSWAYVGGDNPAWAGTTMTFSEVGPSPMGPGTAWRFTHGPFEGEAAQAVPMITYIWAQILARLGAYAEQGTVDPFFTP